jgi:hypothetical protein
LYKNTTHDTAPVKEGIVRSETIFSALILRSDENDPGSSKITALVQSDMKGSLSKFVFSHFAVDGAVSIQEAIVKYYNRLLNERKKVKARQNLD